MKVIRSQYPAGHELVYTDDSGQEHDVTVRRCEDRGSLYVIVFSERLGQLMARPSQLKESPWTELDRADRARRLELVKLGRSRRIQ